MIGFKRHLALLSLTALTACGGSSEDASAASKTTPAHVLPKITDLLVTPLLEPQPTDPIHLRFNWSALKLQVAEVSWKEPADKPAMCAEMGYEIGLEESADHWILTRANTRIDRIDGTPIADLPESARIGVLSGTMYPDCIVLPDGEFGGLVDFESFAAGVPETLRSLGADEKAIETMASPAFQPMFRGMVQKGAQESWLAWVEHWINLEGPPEGEWSAENPDEVLPGLTLNVAYHFRIHGYVVEPAGHVLISGEITMGDEAAAMLDFITGLAEEMDAPRLSNSTEQLDGWSFSSASRIVLVTDPETMIPHHVTSERLVRMKTADKPETTHREAMEWRFGPLPKEKR